jgi:hypothetical protein
VRAEEKELEGPDLEREERTREESEEQEEELPALGGEAIRDVELEHRTTLFDALRLVLSGEHVVVDLLYLPQRETHALLALQAAVSGHDNVGEFVFAEDRQALLEQALAVLQQNVTYGQPEQMAELHAKFDEMTEQIGELRERLVNLEDAQEELFDEHRARDKAEAADEGDKDDKDDKPRPKPGDAALDGPERPVPPKPPSTLAGPEQPEAPKPASTLAGPDRPDAPKPASTLDGPERPTEPTPPSTLSGDAPPEPPKPPSELAAEGAAAEEKKPWWRWPFG